MASTLRPDLGWDIRNPNNSTLLLQQISVSIKELIHLGRDFPWPRPERCPRCGHCRLWGHGFVPAYFEGDYKPVLLRRYRCPVCRLILRLKPSGYFQRFQTSIESIRQSLSHRFYRHLWPPGSSRQRQGHWFRSLFRQAKIYLGLSGFEDILEAFDRLMALGITPVSRSVQSAMGSDL